MADYVRRDCRPPPVDLMRACIAARFEIYDVRFVCPSVACFRTNFAGRLSANATCQNQEGENSLRDIE